MSDLWVAELYDAHPPPAGGLSEHEERPLDFATPPNAAGNAPSALRLTRGIALAWILVNAASPMLYALGWTALNKEVRPNDPFASWLPLALSSLAAFGLPAPLLLQAFVLRRAAPALRWWQIVPAMLAAWIVGLAAAIAAEDSRQVQLDFLRGALRLAEFRWDEFVGLPWVALVGRAGTLAAICMLVPSWVFARAANVRFWAPLLAAIGASMVVALLWALWVLAGVDFDLLDRRRMNGWTWDKRASALVSQALAQAIWSTVALLILAWVVRAPHGAMQSSQRFMLGATALVGALLVPGAVAVLAPGGGERLQLAVRRALSPTPAQDVSEGEPLLQYAFSAPVRVREVPWKASSSPDGRWVVAVASDRQVVVVDAATGTLAHRFPDVLGVHESPEWAWSPDSRWLALRTRGDMLPGKSVRHQVRLRLYAVPSFAHAGEYRHTGAQCLSETHVESAVLFERSGLALWFACGLEFQPTASDLVALRLNVPQLQVQAERRYGDAAPWHLGGLKEVGGSIWAWHTNRRPPYARFRDLGRDRVPVVLQPPPEDRSPQPEWTLQDVSFDEAKAVARFNAWSERRQRLLVHDMRTGAMTSLTDDRLPTSDAAYAFASTAGGLRIESHGRHASRAGELVVVDAASGRVRQRIRTVAQHPLSVSADGRLLVTQTGGELRVYRIQRP